MAHETLVLRNGITKVINIQGNPETKMNFMFRLYANRAMKTAVLYLSTHSSLKQFIYTKHMKNTQTEHFNITVKYS